MALFCNDQFFADTELYKRFYSAQISRSKTIENSERKKCRYRVPSFRVVTIGVPLAIASSRIFLKGSSPAI